MNSLRKKLLFFNNVPLRPASLSVVVALKTAAYSSSPKDRLKCSSIAGSLTPPTVLTPVLWPPAAADGVSDGVGVTAVSSIVVPEFFSEEFQLVANVNRLFLYSSQASARRASRHIVKARSHPMRQTIACSWLPPARPRTTAASHSPNEFA